MEHTLPPSGARGHTVATENIFLFLPNLIGYTRIILATCSCYFMPLHPRTCCILYSVSCLLDALDGIAARTLEQSTRFGAVLDMVTDRCTTSCLLVFLASAFPRWSIFFQSLISLDLASHYMHMYAILAMGSSTKSHKTMDQNRSWVMKLYYSNTKVLFTVCFMNELFFISLYLISFSSAPSTTPRLGSHQETASKPSISSQTWTAPWSAGAMEMARANKVDSSVPWILLYSSLIFMVFKQYVNIIQMVEASKWLAEGDAEIRKQAGLPRGRKYQ